MFPITTILLIGGGHAHLQCIINHGKHPLPHTQITLLSANRYQYYSGMFSGFAEGIYEQEDIRIDLQALCEKNNIKFVEATALSIDASQKMILCSNGTILSYDIASFNIGSSTNIPFPTSEHSLTLKPNYTFTETVEKLQDATNPIIVGGGSAGVELGLSILSRKKRLQQDGTVTLISSSRILPEWSERAIEKLTAICQEKGLQVYTDEKVVSITETNLETEQRTLAHTGVLLLTGPAPYKIFKQGGLACSEDGYLVVNGNLQSVSDSSIFGAGDCVTLETYPSLAKNGVYAVRQGKVLWKNIRNALSGNKLSLFHPQKRFLSILSTGDEEALLLYGSIHIHGSLSWKLKNKIDRGFMEKFKFS